MFECIFKSFSVWYNFCNSFFPKPPGDFIGPQFKKHCPRRSATTLQRSKHVSFLIRDFNISVFLTFPRESPFFNSLCAAFPVIPHIPAVTAVFTTSGCVNSIHYFSVLHLLPPRNVWMISKTTAVIISRILN
jgi:hypothetical protein